MRSLGLVFAILVMAGACKGKTDEGDPTKVTVESKDDATEPIVDENYRFTIKWPGAGWKLMRAYDASKMMPDAVAGAMHEESLIAGVIAESAPGLKLEAYVDLLLDSGIQLANKKIEKREALTFAGIPAVRVSVTGSLDGLQMRYINTIFLHQSYGYQVVGLGRPNELSESGAQLQPFFDSFSIQPGKVSARNTTPVVKEADGVGWRVRDGVFESGVTAIRARPTDAWRIAVGQSLFQLNADAEVGLVHSDPDVYVVLIVERAPPAAGRAEFLKALQSGVAADAERGQPVPMPFAGKPLDLVPFTKSGALPLEHLHGVYYHGDQLVQVLAWYLAPDRERARKVMPAGLAVFDFLGAAERTKLLAELERAPDTQSAIGAQFSVRRGVYRNFESGYTWTKPAASMWRITAGDAAGDGFDVKLLESARNIFGSLSSTPSIMTIDEVHAAHVDAFEGTKSKPTTLTLGSMPARVTTIETTHQGLPMRFLVLSATNGKIAVELRLWGARADLEKHTAALDKAIRGLEFSTKPATETGTPYVDHRLGFSVKAPLAYRFNDYAAGPLAADRSVVVWESGSRALGAFAINMTITDEKWLYDYMEQMIRDQLGKLVSGSATRTEVTVDGRRARRLEWGNLEVHILIRDQVAYAYFNTPDAPGIEAFRLLD